jgi:hypothetical protein
MGKIGWGLLFIARHNPIQLIISSTPDNCVPIKVAIERRLAIKSFQTQLDDASTSQWTVIRPQPDIERAFRRRESN